MNNLTKKEKTTKVKKCLLPLLIISYAFTFIRGFIYLILRDEKFYITALVAIMLAISIYIANVNS